MYAILDIETTGGQYNEEGITEIAIYRFDGHEVVDQFISLVNPEKPIQPFVVKLTGINNAMLRSAPKFHEVAKRIVEITDGCILVAHNASFDYRVLRTEFRRLGYDFQKHTLCTVELSQKLLPEQPSHSLGKLVRALGIPMADRHRATGDALATVKLFKLLLEKDTDKEILTGLVKFEIEKGLAPKLLDIVDRMPSRTGVYYIHNETGEIIYIGKARNIRKRINQHFTDTLAKSKKIQALVYDVTYEETGSELIAGLKESEEIKRLKPTFNRTQKKTVFPFSIYQDETADGYLSLRIAKTDPNRREVDAFVNRQQAQNALYDITERYTLCQKINALDTVDTYCFPHSLGKCNGACQSDEQPEAYNARVMEFLENERFFGANLLVTDNGRTVNERSAVLIENGILRGYCYFDLNYQVTRPDILHNILIPMPANRDTTNILRFYLKRNKFKKILRF